MTQTWQVVAGDRQIKEDRPVVHFHGLTAPGMVIKH
jgi:hypothetical protein